MLAIEKAGNIGFVILILYVIVIYYGGSKLLVKYNFQKNSNFSLLAWIPILRLYLLGKYTTHKLVGLLLIVALFLTGKIYYVEDNIEKTITLIPENIGVIVSYVYLISVLILFLLLFLKTEKVTDEQSNNLLNKSELFNQNDAILKSLEKTPTIDSNNNVINNINFNNNINNNLSNNNNFNNNINNNLSDNNLSNNQINK